MLFKYSKLIALVLSSLTLSCSISELSQQSFEGQWSIKSFHITSENLSPSLINGATSEASSSTYIFKEDQSFTLDVTTNQEHVSGTWQFDQEQSLLTLTFLYQEGDLIEEVEEVYTVENIEGSDLKLHQEMRGLGTIDMILQKN